MTTTAPETHAAMNATAQTLMARFENRTATIGIIGLGYVGLPLARAMHDVGYAVLGFDVDQRKVDMLTRGETYMHHLGTDLVSNLAASDRFEATSDKSRLGEMDAILLCVPTPLGKHHEPDLSFVLDSTRLAAATLRPGQLVILESTTYPGTTRDEMLPILEKSGLKGGEDFFVAYSPEREDPGRKDASTATIPKLVGGIDEVSTDLAMAMYAGAIHQLHRVKSAEIAEAAKLLENIYRAVNIAMVNELKMVLTDMDIDVWEVIEAASTKPFGFQPFYPGPGLGGHCIPIDPFYLTWKAKAIGCPTRFIELAGEINNHMPAFVISRVVKALNDNRKSLRDSKVLVIGVAYKPDIDDPRETPAARVIELLTEHGAVVNYHDPHIPVFPEMRKHNIDMRSIDLNPDVVAQQDCVLIVTNHSSVNYDMIARHAQLIVDSRNAMEDVPEIRAPLVKA
jgi:UDP-N-acetyl-D-glucosamine dehydrogenase